MTPTRILAALSIFAAGCGGAHAEQSTHTARQDNPGASATTTASRVATSGGELATNDDANCNVPPVYFEFESDVLSAQARDALVRSAQCIKQHADRPVRLIGAADPRGTEEYNIALGDRRARTVAHYLASLGVPDARLQVTSVGEEYAHGTDEQSWAQDRWVKDH